MGSCRDTEFMTLSVVKGGRGGAREDRFLDRSIIVIGWEELSELPKYPDLESLKTAYRAAFPGSRAGNVAVQAGQLCFACPLEAVCPKLVGRAATVRGA